MSAPAFSAAADQVEGVFPLPPSQQGMLYQHLLAPRSGAYVPQMAIALRGSLRPECLQEAWRCVLARHGALRSIFARLETAQPVQIILKKAPLPWLSLDWREQTADQQELSWQRLCREQWLTPFELTQTPLMRLVLVQLAIDEWRFLWTHHHVLSDGWSTQRVLAELMEIYEQRVDGGVINTESRPGWIRYLQWWQAQDRKASQRYWQGYLANGQDDARSLPLIAAAANPAREGQCHEGQCNECHWQADEALYQRLRRTAQQQRLTINGFMKLAWALVLARMNDAEQVCFGATLSGRPSHLAAVETIVGQLIQTVPVRVHLSAQHSVRQCLQQLQDEQLLHDQHCHLGLTAIQDCAAALGASTPASSGLFDTLLVFENFPQQARPQRLASGVSLQRLAGVSQNHYPLTLAVFAADQLEIKLKFDHLRISKAAARCYLSYLPQALESVLDQLEQPLDQLSIHRLPERQVKAWLQAGSAHQIHHESPLEWECGSDATAAFWAWTRTPADVVAVVQGQQDYRYGELRARIYQQAHYLQLLELNPGDEVAILLPWGIDFLVALLACQYCALVPVLLDPQQPPAYLSLLLKHTDCALVICQAQQQEALSHSDIEAEWIVLERDAEEIATQIESPPPMPAALMQQASWPAYKIFTSGSTGAAKAVVVSRASLQHYCRALVERLKLPAQARLMAFASVAADLGFSASFAALFSGRSLQLCDEALYLDAPALNRYLAEHSVDVLKLTPSHLHSLLNAGLDRRCLPSTILCGGEALTADLVQLLVDADLRLFNHYGPSEATVGVLCTEVDLSEVDLKAEPANIAAGLAAIPIANDHTQDQLGAGCAVVLDQQLRPQGPGGVGELYLAGPGLAQAYANDARTSATVFLPQCAVDDEPVLSPGARMYRSGDRVLLDEAGGWRFIGRYDDQIKIRGHRVDPAQLEHFLTQQPTVQALRVLLHEGALVAAVMSDADVQLASLNALLPSAMQLQAMHRFEQWPLTANGKFDRQALFDALKRAELDTVPGHSAAAKVAPRLSRQQQQVLRVWQQLLKQREIDLEQAFFSAGGNSLLLMQLHAQLQKLSGRNFAITQLFEHTSINAMARLISQPDDAKECGDA